MPRQIAIIQGHPDPRGNHFGHALAAAYADGAEAAGNEVTIIEVAKLSFPLLQTKEDFEQGTPPEAIAQAQNIINDAQHLLLIYPLWLGDLPAVLKGFLEQVFRPSFTGETAAKGKLIKRPLKGKSARIVVTMGMPAFFYRWFFRAHSLKNLTRNVLGFCGIGPIKTSLIGAVENSETKRREWLDKMRELGSAAK